MRLYVLKTEFLHHITLQHLRSLVKNTHASLHHCMQNCCCSYQLSPSGAASALLHSLLLGIKFAKISKNGLCFSRLFAQFFLSRSWKIRLATFGVTVDQQWDTPCLQCSKEKWIFFRWENNYKVSSCLMQKWCSVQLTMYRICSSTIYSELSFYAINREGLSVRVS